MWFFCKYDYWNFFFNLTQNRVLSPVFFISLEQARQFSGFVLVCFVFFKLWKHCSSVNQFQNDQDKFLNDCYKEIIMLENIQYQLWLCRRFSTSGSCVTVESCWPQGSSIQLHVRLHLPFPGTWSLSEFLESPPALPCLNSWVFFQWKPGYGWRAWQGRFHGDLESNKYFF